MSGVTARLPITGLLQHKFWDLVYFHGPDDSFPSKGGNKALGRWLGRALNYGDKMCYYILNIKTGNIVVRSMVRSAENTERPNRGAAEAAGLDPSVFDNKPTAKDDPHAGEVGYTPVHDCPLLIDQWEADMIKHDKSKDHRKKSKTLTKAQHKLAGTPKKGEMHRPVHLLTQRPHWSVCLR